MGSGDQSGRTRQSLGLDLVQIAEDDRGQRWMAATQAIQVIRIEAKDA
jgi:hypothetical protein